LRTIALMERAGQSVAKYVLSISKPDWKVAVVCGKGNNGGDGFVAARHIARSLHTEVYLAESEISSDIARYNFEAVRNLVRQIQSFEPKRCDVIVDAMLGVGLQGRPHDPYPKLIKALNESKRMVVSVDVPSGWPSGVQVRPDVTVTLHAPKVGMTKPNSGKIVVEDIGIPPEAELYCGPGDFALLPRRKKDAHKGDAGRVLVIGGGPYMGAPAFTGMAAMRSGADLTFVFTPESAALPVSIYSPNMIVRALDGDILTMDHVAQVVAFSAGVDVIAIGPGLGSNPETVQAVQEIVRRSDKPLVIDADAIGACGAKPSILRRKTGVITPHAGEFKKLTGKTPPAEDLTKRSATVKEAARKFGMTILLKGPTDVISDGTYVKLKPVRCGADWGFHLWPCRQPCLRGEELRTAGDGRHRKDTIGAAQASSIRRVQVVTKELANEVGHTLRHSLEHPCAQDRGGRTQTRRGSRCSPLRRGHRWLRRVPERMLQRDERDFKDDRAWEP
jgi:hydroxyethylthiazole kinase-like uncharacterized protein yjeF